MARKKDNPKKTDKKLSYYKRVAKNIEYKVEKMFGGKRIPLSGSSWLKGDVITDEYLIEVKTRTFNSTTIWIDPKWVEQTLRQAEIMKRKPLLVIYDRKAKNFWRVDFTDEPCSPEKHSFGFFDTELCIKGRKCYASLLPRPSCKRKR